MTRNSVVAYSFLSVGCVALASGSAVSGTGQTNSDMLALALAITNLITLVTTILQKRHAAEAESALIDYVDNDSPKRKTIELVRQVKRKRKLKSGT